MRTDAIHSYITTFRIHRKTGDCYDLFNHRVLLCLYTFLYSISFFCFLVVYVRRMVDSLPLTHQLNELQCGINSSFAIQTAIWRRKLDSDISRAFACLDFHFW